MGLKKKERVGGGGKGRKKERIRSLRFVYPEWEHGYGQIFFIFGE